MVVRNKKMDEVAEKLLNDAALICFQCSRREDAKGRPSECPSNCGALVVIECAENILSAIEERDRVFEAA